MFIRDQQKRWASCDQRGNVRFNWRIIQAPMSLVDYVVVHELAHLKHEVHAIGIVEVNPSVFWGDWICLVR